MRPLFQKHMDNILSGQFSQNMMEDWKNNDENLLKWRAASAETAFEKTPAVDEIFSDQVYFDNGTVLVSFVKSGVELAYEIMTKSGIGEASAYYESLHELPLIANTIARKKLYEMNRVISDTAEYGCYLFDQECQLLLEDFMQQISTSHVGEVFSTVNEVDNQKLIAVNSLIRSHPIETVGTWLRGEMTKNDN